MVEPKMRDLGAGGSRKLDRSASLLCHEWVVVLKLDERHVAAVAADYSA